MTGGEPVHVPGSVRGALAVMRHEVRLAFHSPMSYVLALGFALSMSVAIFVAGEFLSTDEASPRLFALFLPWAAVVFVPALAMRAWSAGPEDRGLEFAMSLPLGDGALVTGKFLAGLVVLGFVLLLTTAFPATVAWLGEPDPGAMAGAYLVGFALLAAFYAVALAAAAVTADATAAFVAGACVLFSCSGWSCSAAKAPRVIWRAGWRRGAWDVVTSIGPPALDRGAVEWTGGGGLAGVLRDHDGARARDRPRPPRLAPEGGPGARDDVARRRCVRRARRRPRRGRPVSRNRWGGFIDISEEREHTLAPGTREVLEALPSGVTATPVLERGSGRYPHRDPHPCAPRRCDARTPSRAQAAGGSRCAGVILVPTPRPRSPPSAAGLRRVPMTSGDAFFLGVEFRRGVELRSG